jgi:cytochrome P450
MDPEVRFTPESLATPDVRADPYPAYRKLRPHSPFLYPYLPAGMAPGLDEPVMAWALLRHADVDRAARDYETFSSGHSPIVEKGLSPHLTLLFDDPPRHLRLRRLINYAFTARRVEALEPWIRDVAGELLGGLGSGEVDVMERFAVPLPMMVIARLLGIPRDDYRTFRQWSQAFVATVTMPHDERQRSIREMTAYFGEAVRARRARGADVLLTALAEARVDGEALEDAEILGLCIVLLVAGNETTVNLIGAMLHLLAERPDLWQRLREDRNLTPAFVEETLRYASPVQRMPRRTTRPRWFCSSARRTATRRRSPTRTTFDSIATRASTSHSGRASTTAWARRWPGPRRASPWARCSIAFLPWSPAPRRPSGRPTAFTSSASRACR